MKFDATTTKGRKLDLNWDAINAYVSRWRPGTRLEISITRRQQKISDPMRKMYFAAILPVFANGLGYDPDEYLLFHRQLKIVYFQVQSDKKGIYRNVPHVFADESTLPVSEKSKFVEWVLRKAAIEGIYIETKGGK